jgi:chaperonin GroES
MKIQPLFDRILVKVAAVEQVSASGLVIPEAAQERKTTGTIVAIGEGARDANGQLIPNQVKLGQEVIFNKHTGTEVNYDGESYLVMSPAELLAVVM